MKKNNFTYPLQLWRHFFIPLLILLAIVIIGVLGFTTIHGYSILQSLYLVAVILTTVGLRPVSDGSSLGMLFDILFIIVGVGTVVVLIGRAIEFIVSGELIRVRRRRAMEKKIEFMKNHYIICGFGRVGHQVAVEFKAAKIPYVVIDSKPETAEELDPQNVPYLIGDITSDEILLSAGIKHAKGLIASADSDTANVFVVLSARVLNPNLIIIARAGTIDTEEKLKKAGANRVISPYFIAGKRMAALATKPTAVEFLDTVLHSENVEMEMRELLVSEGCALAGKTLEEAEIRQRSGAYIAAIRKAGGVFNLQPTAGSKMEAGDILVAIGTPHQLDLLERCLQE
ncbi:MAG: potassium channel family protein [Candidatus Margulisiibacteriota bacterium]